MISTLVEYQAMLHMITVTAGRHFTAHQLKTQFLELQKLGSWQELLQYNSRVWHIPSSDLPLWPVDRDGGHFLEPDSAADAAFFYDPFCFRLREDVMALDDPETWVVGFRVRASAWLHEHELQYVSHNEPGASTCKCVWGVSVFF